MMRSGLVRGAFVAGGLALVLVPRRAGAYRPFDGTDADVAPPQVFELELGPLQYQRQGAQNFLVTPALVLNLGLGERTELVVDASEFVALGSVDLAMSRVRLGDDDVLLKHVFREGILQGRTGVSLAAEAGVLTPEVGGGEGARAGGSLDIIASYQWSWATVHWNEWFEYTRDRHADLFNGVIFEGPRAWTVRPVAEIFYDRDFAAGSTESVLCGAIWELSEALSLDAGLRGARMEDSYAAEARFGLTWSAPVGDRSGD